MDEALRFALVAKGQLRRSPQVNDTLGWIYVRQEQPLEAIPLLAACAGSATRQPVVPIPPGRGVLESRISRTGAAGADDRAGLPEAVRGA